MNKHNKPITNESWVLVPLVHMANTLLAPSNLIQAMHNPLLSNVVGKIATATMLNYHSLSGTS